MSLYSINFSSLNASARQPSLTFRFRAAGPTRTTTLRETPSPFLLHLLFAGATAIRRERPVAGARVMGGGPRRTLQARGARGCCSGGGGGPLGERSWSATAAVPRRLQLERSGARQQAAAAPGWRCRRAASDAEPGGVSQRCGPTRQSEREKEKHNTSMAAVPLLWPAI